MNSSIFSTKVFLPLLVVLFLSTIGCSAKQSVIDTGNQSPPASTRADTPVQSIAPTDSQVSANPPVSYEPAWPERTVTTDQGYLVNSCVPEELRSHVTTLKTSDDVNLSALVLGSGSNGVLLDHEQGYNICSFIELGEKLAEEDYLVVIPEYRNHGASQVSDDNDSIDLDAEAALDELARQGAKRVFLAGASCGGTTAIISGVRQQLPIQGLLILSSPAKCGPLDAIPSVKRLTAPSLFVVSPGDMQGAVEKHVRRLYNASGAVNKELIIDDSGFHGTDMMKQGENGEQLFAKIMTFIEAAFE